jgi:hypothetical protein
MAAFVLHGHPQLHDRLLCAQDPKCDSSQRCLGGRGRGNPRVERSRGSLGKKKSLGYGQGRCPVPSSSRRDLLAALELRMKAGFHAHGLPDPEFLPCTPTAKDFARSNGIRSCFIFKDEIE